MTEQLMFDDWYDSKEQAKYDDSGIGYVLAKAAWDYQQEIIQDKLKNSYRYEWLRKQFWEKAELCVIVNPRASLKFGTDCPSLDRLDKAIDSAMENNNEI